jgi:hypothetical protein
MKKLSFLLFLLFVTSVTFAQKKEKIKGSRNVVIQPKDVIAFDAIEVQDELEVLLVKGDKNELELEADDNLQDALSFVNNGNVLVLSTYKNITSYKKFALRVTYTDSLKTVITKNKSKVTALEAIKLNNITFKPSENSKLFLNVASKNFNLVANDKTYIELNNKSDVCNIELSNNAELKALISTADLKFDMYQNALATVEGDAVNTKLRLDNDSEFTGKKLTVKNMKLVTEASSKCAILVDDSIKIAASGESEIQLLGNPKIEIEKFNDTAKLLKKKK